MSHGKMSEANAVALGQRLATGVDTGAQISKAHELAANYIDDPRQDIQTDVMNAFYQGVKWREENPAPDAENPLLVIPLTLGGFKGAFYVQHRREPTMQEIFDAGVRAGMERMDMHIKAALA